ncbi:uncharacterized protein LOC141657278 isoform X2 [Silene latifolia]|uniref:uncharacterized protein LOC141657278 isoform X2 n=1 Tax=Silene latifolia TaxID=37657 RepID=UPI003D774FE6
MSERCKDGNDTNRYELRSKSISQSAGSKSIPVQPSAQLKRRNGPRCRFPKRNPNICSKYHNQEPAYPNLDPEDIPTMEDEGMKKLSHKYANAALSYLSQQGHDFNLVLADYYQPAVVGGGVRIHHNFQAKRPNDPPQLTETFFCQLFYHRGRDYNLRDLTVECCVSLGRSDSLPKKRDNYGCGYCTIFTYHPKNGCDGLIWGRSGQ